MLILVAPDGAAPRAASSVASSVASSARYPGTGYRETRHPPTQNSNTHHSSTSDSNTQDSDVASSSSLHWNMSLLSDDATTVLETVHVPDIHLAEWVRFQEEASQRPSEESPAHSPAQTPQHAPAQLQSQSPGPNAATAPTRWVFLNTRDIYLTWFNRGISVERAYDLAAIHKILKNTLFVPAHFHDLLRQAGAPLLPADSPESLQPHDPGAPRHIPGRTPSSFNVPLFGLDTPAPEPEELLEQMRILLATQLRALQSATKPRHLQLLVAAESVGALIAVEMESFGVPWSVERHRELLNAALGGEPVRGERPDKLARLAEHIIRLLAVPPFNVDSPQELLRALHRAGIETKSTRKYELRRFSHPAIEPILEYKKLARLMSANGWNWLREWVREGRFHPEYVVAGAPTGRWASSGGGAMQIPHNVREAVVPDPGWTLVVGDAAQLEPRVLAAMSQDDGLAEAGRGHDLYQATADQVFKGDRSKAKIAILGAIYGATTGASAELKPALLKNYPQALALVEKAARVGEQGGSVHTFLGRTSEPVSQRWLRTQQAETAAAARAAASIARTRGRFTRNFVVQGTAAEWAECWMGELRRRLRAMGATGRAEYAPQLVSFLHDEVVVHVPLDQVEQVCTHIVESARDAARLVFGEVPVEFPITLAVVERYSDAKD